MTPARNDQIVCICADYQCPKGSKVSTDIEPTHLAYSSALSDGFLLVMDPETTPNWGRTVRPNSKCVSKESGEPIRYSLSFIHGTDSIGQKATDLLLDIE